MEKNSQEEESYWEEKFSSFLPFSFQFFYKKATYSILEKLQREEIKEDALIFFPADSILSVCLLKEIEDFSWVDPLLEEKELSLIEILSPQGEIQEAFSPSLPYLPFKEALEKKEIPFYFLGKIGNLGEKEISMEELDSLLEKEFFPQDKSFFVVFYWNALENAFRRRDLPRLISLIEEIDRYLFRWFELATEKDFFFITSTGGLDIFHYQEGDYTREYVPVFFYNSSFLPYPIRPFLGVRKTYMDITQSIASILELEYSSLGEPFI